MDVVGVGVRAGRPGTIGPSEIGPEIPHTHTLPIWTLRTSKLSSDDSFLALEEVLKEGQERKVWRWCWAGDGCSMCVGLTLTQLSPSGLHLALHCLPGARRPPIAGALQCHWPLLCDLQRNVGFIPLQVDLILLGGDLFHDNTPSRSTVYRCRATHAAPISALCLSPHAHAHTRLASPLKTTLAYFQLLCVVPVPSLGQDHGAVSEVLHG